MGHNSTLTNIAYILNKDNSTNLTIQKIFWNLKVILQGLTNSVGDDVLKPAFDDPF